MCDVIIVGGGMAGLSAALAAGEAGADVLVLESEPTVGGLDGAQRRPDLGAGQLRARAAVGPARQSRPAADPRRRDRAGAGNGSRPTASRSTRRSPCLKDRMGRGPPDGRRRARRARAVGGHPRRRRAAPGRRGARRRAASGRRARRGRLDRHAGPGRIAVQTRVRARSRRLLRRRLPELGGARAPLHQPVARGDGRAQQPLERRRRPPQPRAARRAVTHGMHSFYGHTLPYIPGKTWDNGLEFLAGSLYFSDYCLIVNQLGLRFTDESVGCIDEHNAERGCQQPHGALLRDLRRAHPPRAHRRRPHGHPRHRGHPRPRQARPAARPRRVDRLRRDARTSSPRPWRPSSASPPRTWPTRCAPSTPRRTRSASSTRPAAATTPRSRRPRCARSPASPASPTRWAA